MLNKIFLQGRLVADPELKQTQTGTPVASFRLAVDHDFKDKSTGKNGVDFITCVAWRQTADFVNKYFQKGRMMIAVGRLQMRTYTDKDGNKRTAAEVVIDTAYFGDSKPADGASGAAPSAQQQFQELAEDDGELPF